MSEYVLDPIMDENPSEPATNYVELTVMTATEWSEAHTAPDAASAETAEEADEEPATYTVPPEYERNLGLFSEDEQRRLGEARVAVAGAGGDGGMLAIQLARLGVGTQGGELRLADPDPFEAQNINRQAACTTETVDVNKAEAVAEYIRKINPNIAVTTYTDGVTPENVEAFVGGVDLLIDETEFTIHSIGILLARQARAEGVSNLHVMNIGFGAQLTSYAPDSKHTLERRLGINDGDAEQEVGIDKWLANIPRYADLDVFKVVASGEKSAPSVAPGVALAASIGATQATLHLLGTENNRPEPVVFPKTLVMDAYTGESQIVNNARRGFMTSMARTAWNNLRGKVPKASY